MRIILKYVKDNDIKSVGCDEAWEIAKRITKISRKKSNPELRDFNGT